MQHILLLGESSSALAPLTDQLAGRFVVSVAPEVVEVDVSPDLLVVFVDHCGRTTLRDTRLIYPKSNIVAVVRDVDDICEATLRSAGASSVIPERDLTASYLAAIVRPTTRAGGGGEHAQIELTATLSMDSKGRVTRASPYMAELLGSVSGRQLIGQTFQSMFARPRHGESVVARCVPGSTVRNVEAELRRADGTSMWALITLRRTKNGAKLHASVADVTDLAQAWQTLARSEMRYRSLFESVPVPIWEIDLRPAVSVLGRVKRQRPNVSRLELAAHLVGALRLVHANDSANDLVIDDVQSDSAVIRSLVRAAGGPTGIELLGQVERFVDAGRSASTYAIGRGADGSERKVSVTWNAPVVGDHLDLSRATVSVVPVESWGAVPVIPRLIDRLAT